MALGVHLFLVSFINLIPGTSMRLICSMEGGWFGLSSVGNINLERKSWRWLAFLRRKIFGVSRAIRVLRTADSYLEEPAMA